MNYIRPLKVRVVTRCPGGETIWDLGVRFENIGTAIRECDRLQAEYDADGEPKKVSVIDATNVTVWTSGARGPWPTEEVTEALGRT